MHADSYFRRGTTHDVCQDYALSGEVNGRPFGIVADGCSSSPHTDFGARFLAFGAREALRQSFGAFRYEAVLPLACAAVGHMVPMACLDATLGIVYGTETHIHVWLSGDGVIVARRKDGSYWVTVVEFSGNAPGYLSYQLNGNRFQALTGEGGPGGIRQIDDVVLSSHFTETDRKRLGEKRLSSDPRSYWTHRVYPAELFDLAAVMTDGASSFQCPSEHGGLEVVPLNEVLSHVLAYKGMVGRFAARRLNRFLGRHCRDQGWSHGDDFAFAAVYAGG